MDMTVTRARAVASANISGLRFFEVHLRNEENRCVGIVNMFLDSLKAKGVVKTLNGFKKLNAWLETEEGLAYAKELLARKHERERRHFT
jgi:hypothetical protein